MTLMGFYLIHDLWLSTHHSRGETEIDQHGKLHREECREDKQRYGYKVRLSGSEVSAETKVQRNTKGM